MLTRQAWSPSWYESFAAGTAWLELLRPKRKLAAGLERHSFCRMSTLTEIEMAVPHLGADELSHLERLIHSLRTRKSKQQRSAFDLVPLQLGKVLQPLNAADDLLEEMLNDSRD